MEKIHLITVDPQADFCLPSGSLYAQGAHEDMERLAAFIGRHGGRFERIHVTLDQHHFLDIAHPVFWKDSRGEHPSPFTIITVGDVEDGKWLPTIPSARTRALEYVKALETGKRYALCIWPPHCLIGSPGAAVHPAVHRELMTWEASHLAAVDFVTKGTNCWTEHYSAVMAEVIDPDDPGTSLNTGLIRILRESDCILISGEALSHCVANTITDIANNFGEENIRKFVVLEDCTSPVPGFESLGTDFMDRMVKRGMRVSNTTDFF